MFFLFIRFCLFWSGSYLWFRLHFIFLTLASQGFRTNTILSKTQRVETNTDTSSWLWHFNKKSSSGYPDRTKTKSLDWRRKSNFYKFSGNIWTDSLELTRTEATTRIFSQIENVSSVWVSTEAFLFIHLFFCHMREWAIVVVFHLWNFHHLSGSFFKPLCFF